VDGGGTASGCAGMDDTSELPIVLLVEHAATIVRVDKMASAVAIFNMVHTPSD
jgi:hypothetical protein